jgi:hypothetical protein
LEIEMATTEEKQYFNLHVAGIGYLNRVRWVTPTNTGGRRSDPFLACSISALRGSSDAPAYTHFDLRVSGEEAIEIVDGLKQDVDEKRKVIVSFRVGDIYAHAYERDVRENGKPTGQQEKAVLIKGRLLRINTVKVDGELVYTRPQEDEPTGDGAVAEGDTGSSESNAPAMPEARQQPAQPQGRAPAPTQRFTPPARRERVAETA